MRKTQQKRLASLYRLRLKQYLLTAEAMVDLDTKSTVIVDAMALTRSLASVHRDFTILEFLDLCTTIEALVLNDKITVLDSTPELLNAQAEMKALESAGILLHKEAGVKLSDGGPALQQFKTFMSRMMDAGKLPKTPLGNTTFGDAFREATVISEAERRLQISALPLRRFAGFYEPKVLVREEHTACDLVANYEILSRYLREGRKLYRYPLSNYIIAEIPPMPILALTRAPSRERLLEVALELRDEYSGLRQSLSELRSNLSNQEVSPKEKKRLVTSWARSWKTLDKYAPSTTLALANTPSMAVDMDKSIDGEYLDFNLNNIVSNLGKTVREEWYGWRIRILHDAAKQYLRTSDGTIARETERLFAYELSSTDLRQLADWDSQMMKLATEDRSVPQDA